MTTAVTSSKFEPLHKGHSIDQCAIGLAFEGVLDDAGLKAVVDAIGKPENLPGRIELRGVSFQIGQGGPGATRPGTLAGYTFTRSRPDGVVDAELQLQRNMFAFRTMSYTRWAQLLKECLPHFEAVLPQYLTAGRMTQISLNYVDKFVARDAPTNCRPSEILKKGSPYVSPGVFDSEDLWHSHCGFFKRLDANTKQLTTINVDYIVETLPITGDRATVSISTVLAHLFNQPTYTPLSVAPQEGVQVLKGRLETLHQLDKQVLSGIISPEMAQRIALTS